MSIVQENLRRDMQMRYQTDQRMSTAWIIVPILPFVAWIIFFLVILAAFFSSFSFTFNNTTGTTTPRSTVAATPLFGLIFLGYIIYPVIGIVWAIMLYKLTKRRNMHFQRQIFLYNDLINLAKDIAGKKNIDISLPLNNLDRTTRESQFEETEKGAALWAVLSFIFWFLSFYVFYFLNKDFYRHERRQDLFLDDLARLMAMVGLPVNLPRTAYPIPDRSFILYLVLTIVTAGLFSIYWVYTLLSDPNNHFQHQWMIEDTILAQTGLGIPSPTMAQPSYPQM